METEEEELEMWKYNHVVIGSKDFAQITGGHAWIFVQWEPFVRDRMLLRDSHPVHSYYCFHDTVLNTKPGMTTEMTTGHPSEFQPGKKKPIMVEFANSLKPVLK